MPRRGFKHTEESKKKMSQVKRTRHPPEKRFWKMVDKDGPIHPLHGVCWQWTGSVYEFGIGYGQFRDRSSGAVAHRFSWFLHYGTISDGKLVLHKCDNPRCVNPEHLFLGTHQDNSDDMYTKGRNRSPKGEEKSCSRLTEKDVLEIRSLYGPGCGYKKLAAIYKVYPMTIARVVRRETWKHI